MSLRRPGGPRGLGPPYEAPPPSSGEGSGRGRTPVRSKGLAGRTKKRRTRGRGTPAAPSTVLSAAHHPHAGGRVMPVIISCPDCGRKVRVQDEQLGKKVRCPGCKEV